ncbi:uncharacterized protein LOC106012028 [Aplysia californica]|uniref:Uncharacterized protein LOC106012028 n=1 Tax=Aplysia californica TaxID=6500 RepID=A0ABM1A1S9_APLCA|nr:uncharacterized protein LOC106012028 [Aplysia californica]
MTDLEGTDADGELSDEEVLRSGSQTGVSDQEESQQKVRMGRNVSTRVPIVSLTAKVDNSPSSYINSSSDPVSSILERIDAELDDMDRRNTQTFPSTQAHTSALRPRSSSHGKSSPADTGLGSVSFADDLELTDKDRLTNCHPQQKDQISGSAEIYSEANTTDAFTDDDASRRHDDNNPSDLDSIAAQQIDRKFKEIMRKKKVPPDLPPHPGRPLGALSSRLRSRSANRASANMLSTGTDDKKQQGTDDKDGGGGDGGSGGTGYGQTSGRLGFGAGYGTDNESVKTEDFESKFMNLIVNGSDTERADTAGSAASTARNKSESRINGRSDRTRGGGACGERADKNETALKNTLTPTEDNKQENKRDDANDIIHRLRSIAQSSTPAAPTPILSRPRSVSPTRNR